MSESMRSRRWKRQRRVLRVLAATALICVSGYLFRSFSRVLTQRSEGLAASRKIATHPVKFSRPVYPYSVIRGGAYSKDELTEALESDPVAARHYASFRRSRTRVTKAAFSAPVFLSYRVGDAIYWTRRPVRLPPGEAVLTDGANYARARCGNRISPNPQIPVNETEPAPEILDTPPPPTNAIADLNTWLDDRLMTFQTLPAAGSPAIVATSTAVPTDMTTAEATPFWWTGGFPSSLLTAPIAGILRTSPIVTTASVPGLVTLTGAAPAVMMTEPYDLSSIGPPTPTIPGLPLGIPTTSVPEPSMLPAMVLACAAMALARFVVRRRSQIRLD